MAPPPDDKKPEKSYLSSAVDSINPWSGNRSATPTPKDPQPDPTPVNPGDHSTTSTYGRSFKRYPPDCPPLAVQWFHAVDVPKRKPEWVKSKNPKETKLPPPPKKYVAFSKQDNRALEAAYQKVVEASENERDTGLTRRYVSGSQHAHALGSQDLPNTTTGAAEAAKQKEPGVKVPVNEDFLFDVDIEERELAPAYWLGPTYDVRRGSWFYQEGSSLRPCEENLASQLEEGYLKVKPWLYPAKAGTEAKASDVTPKASVENLKAASGASDSASKPGAFTPQHQPQTHRLFGTYMNSIATYQDVNTAWLSSEGVLSWVTSTMYERFAGGAYMSGVKLVRGYSEPKKAKEEKSKDEKRPTTPAGTRFSGELEEKEQRALKRRSAPPSSRSDPDSDKEERESTDIESRGSRLQRQLSSLIENAENRDPEQEEEEIRKREEKEIQDDYNAQTGESQGRDIEHLILVTHGIGQLLGLRMESVNFIHDVNVLRKTLKSVYSTSADLRALNSELGDGPGNCRIQVLPVCWRHLLDFPKRKGEKRREQDLGETFEEEDEYPSLEDITVEGVAFARSLISDLALDVLLYQSAYREQISEIVFRESNRIYKLFMDRNPGFNGKVHVMGHSLGSAIMFDILCRQKESAQVHDTTMNPLRFWPASEKRELRDPRDLTFDFEVEDFYCLGSPIGLFQMLKGRTISARHLPNAFPTESPLNPDELDDPFATAVPLPGHAGTDQRISPITGLPVTISSPKVSQLYNVFHPSDPISYRLEPLISSAMSSLKPQVLPYTKKGIFGNVSTPQNIVSGLGAKVGQSVSGLWSSLSAGIANNLLNRSLGLTQEEVANFNAQHPPHAASPGAGTNVAAGVISDASALGEKTAARKRQLAMMGGDGDGAAGRKSISGNDVTLIDDELETLYSRFQKDRVETLEKGGADGKGGGGDDGANAKAKAAAGVAVSNWMEEERKAQRLRREEMKVRALNRNGRVDYSIQESVLDFNPINTIASHMAYWSDEDVSHFIMSQLLSNKDRSTSPSKAGTPGMGRAGHIVEWDHLE
ncbi:uncharacterized protein E0L32_000150 [Thyridium curvatum]|uniref:DDHD domain-containing protein n=1 Tax=Thyridium curvatum TaxID=1093900 RepID=A0A507B9H3_9PEZI|nr:uncharacterized protein E0L32_000150 [Thyridium curvatum]TPX15816.1 hypothetical protein E0L32_000150 [Thyridium curvatum]